MQGSNKLHPELQADMFHEENTVVAVHSGESSQSRELRKIADDELITAVSNLRNLRSALAGLSVVCGSAFLVVTSLFAISGVILVWLALNHTNSSSSGLFDLAYSAYLFFTMLLFAYQPVRVTSAATDILIAVAQSGSHSLTHACDRHSALMALMLSSSRGTDCIRVLGVRLEAGALFRLAGLLTSVLLFVGRSIQ